MATFTPAETSRIRFHLGYPDADRIVSTLVGVRDIFASIDQRMRDLNDSGRLRIIELIDTMDGIMAHMRKVPGRTHASELGSIKLNARAFEDLIMQYDTWGRFLGNALSTPYNPFNARGASGGSGSVNGTWSA